MPRFVTTFCFVLALTAGATAAPRLLTLAGPDREALAAEDRIRLDAGGPERFAWPADLSLAPADSDDWDRLPDDGHRWQLRVEALGSLSLNFGFDRFRLPWGARLVLRGSQGDEVVFTAADNRSDGQLWTPVVLGDSALLSLELPPGHRDDFDLSLMRVGRGYRGFGEAVLKQGDCNIDVICPEGDPWRREIRSVGVYTLDGIWKCTGALINNTAQDETPYFLTAYHCDVDAENAASVTIYWNYESPVCGDLSGGSLDDWQSGTIWRAGYAPSDFTLLELSAAPDTSLHLTYAGWDWSGQSVARSVCVHHPSTDEKAISFDDDPLTVTSYIGYDSPGNNTHWRVGAWDLGTTEGGSSGSPLFDPAHRIVGQLHGGYASCSNPAASDWYGRLSVSWNGGGTPETQLAAWLDPTQSGVSTLDTFDPRDPGEPPVEPGPEDLTSLWVYPNPSANLTTTIAFGLEQQAAVTLRIYDLRGRLIDRLDTAVLDPGDHVVAFGDLSVPAGTYICRLEALGEARNFKFTMLR